MKKNIAIILGGFSEERHISVESGRNIYEKLSSSNEFNPIAVFLTGDLERLRLFIIPINVLLKDNADDIAKYLTSKKFEERNEILEFFRQEAWQIRDEYGQEVEKAREITLEEIKSIADFVFIALHGRPGEDGQLQKNLEELGIPYNGSGVETSFICMNKYLTNQKLKANGINVADQFLIERDNFLQKRDFIIQQVEKVIKYPLIGKPVDDGCSAGIRKIENKSDFVQFGKDFFSSKAWSSATCFLIEKFIEKECAQIFFEITCGLLTHYNDNNEIIYEIFYPSKSIAANDILNAEEKFLAGDGQNITPANFSSDEIDNKFYTEIIKEEIKKTAKILNIEGYARIDAFVHIYGGREIKVLIIEVNSLPALTPATCIFHQCILNGYSPLNFIKKIINFGTTRQLLKKL